MPVPSHSLFSSVKLLLRVADGPILPGPVRCRAGPSCQGLFLGDQEPVLRPGLLMPPVVWTGPRFSPQVSAVSWCPVLRQLVPCSPGLSSSLLTSPSHCCRPPGISATRPPCSSPSSSQQHLHVFRPKHRRLPRLCSSPHPLTSICRTVLALSSKPVLHLSLFPSLSAPQLWLSPGDRRSPRTGLLACLPAPFSSVSTQQPEINHNNNVLWCHSPG